MALSASEQREAMAAAAIEAQNEINGPAAKRKHAKEVRAQLEQKRKADGVADAWTASIPEVDKKKIEEGVSENIGTEVDADGKRVLPPGSAEEARARVFREFIDRAKLVASLDYDRISARQKAVIERKIEDVLRSHRDVKAILDPLAGNVRDVIIGRIAKDIDFATFVKSRLEEKLDFRVDKHDVDKKRSDRKEKLDAANKRYNELINHKAFNDIQIAVLKGDDLFTEPDPVKQADGINGALDHINRYKADRANSASVARIDKFIKDRSDLALLEDKINKLTAAGRPVDVADVAASAALRTEVTTNEPSCAACTSGSGAHNEEFHYLVSSDTVSKFKMQDDFRNAHNEYNATHRADFIKADAELTTALRDREFDEDEYIGNLDGVYSEATVDYLKKQLAEAASVGKIVSDADIAKENDIAKKEVLLKIQQGFVNGRKFLGPGPDLKAIDESFALLVDNVGPEAFIDSLGFTPEQRDAVLKDEVLMKKAAETIIYEKMKHGGGISHKDVDRLLTWSGGEDVIKGAIQRNKTSDKLFKELGENGSHGLMDKLRNMTDKKLAAVIISAILLGILSPALLVAAGFIIPAGGLAAAAGVGGAASGAVGTAYAGVAKFSR